MDTKDQGHRFGNFPNYYAFHPPENRLEVLEKTNILSYIRQRLLFLDGVDKDNDDCDGTLAAAIAKEGKVSNKVEPATKKLRIGEKTTKLSARHKHDDGTIIYYCDLGCNEGDLTLAMAASLTSRKCTVPNKAIDESKGKSSENKDGSKLQEEVAIKCLGLDLDPMLINRANAKCSSSSKVENSKQEESISNNIATNGATFKVCNLCSESEHNSACNSFLLHHKILPTDTTDADETKNKQSTSHLPVPIFHLTSIFSTTMWIHVHAGDEGLKSFIERACSWTKRFLLIEPQPSACYRKANTRLRKMGREELEDVTSARLKIRQDVEEAIETIIFGCGFFRVDTDYNESKEVVTTSWNRSLLLYERRVGENA